MFKIFVLVALFAVVYGVPAPRQIRVVQVPSFQANPVEESQNEPDGLEIFDVAEDRHYPNYFGGHFGGHHGGHHGGYYGGHHGGHHGGYGSYESGGYGSHEWDD